MSCKITGLTALNVRAIQEVLQDSTQPSACDVITTKTTAEFACSAREAAQFVGQVKASLVRQGNNHPRGSLHAVERKLLKLAAAESRETALDTVAAELATPEFAEAVACAADDVDESAGLAEEEEPKDYAVTNEQGLTMFVNLTHADAVAIQKQMAEEGKVWYAVPSEVAEASNSFWKASREQALARVEEQAAARMRDHFSTCYDGHGADRGTHDPAELAVQYAKMADRAELDGNGKRAAAYDATVRRLRQLVPVAPVIQPDTEIGELEISVALFNAAHRLGATTADQLVHLTPRDLESLRESGRCVFNLAKTQAELRECQETLPFTGKVNLATVSALLYRFRVTWSDGRVEEGNYENDWQAQNAFQWKRYGHLGLPCPDDAAELVSMLIMDAEAQEVTV